VNIGSAKQQPPSVSARMLTSAAYFGNNAASLYDAMANL
jgi:hypothetical protein